MDAETVMTSQEDALLVPQEGSNSTHVRHVFENTSRYLKSRRVDIQFRIDTVAAYASTVRRERVLDIGCGDGTISLQLATPTSRLTLMDISSSMAATAKANIPERYAHQVDVRNEDFAAASFDSELFDLVVSVGVMAHVDSPNEFLQKIRGLLKPGGSLILEFTDAYHFVGRIGRFWGWVKELVAPAKYSTNKLSYARVAQLLESNHLRVVSTFRYSRVPLPAFNVLVSHAREYKLVKALFGSCTANCNAWLGNEYIFLLTAD